MTEIHEPLPPHNTEAEESVLGSLLIDPVAIEEVIDGITPASFYHPRNRDIYAAMLALHDRGIPTDFELVCDELERHQKLEHVGGVAYVARLLTVVPTSLHAQYYANIVARTALNRHIISAAGRIAAIGYEDEPDILAAHDRVQAEITDVFRGVSQSARGPVHVRDILSQYLEEINLAVNPEVSTRRSRVCSGFMDLDRLLGGFQRSDLVILAARPSIGKTALALNIARNAAVEFDFHTLVYSCEMSGHQVAARLLSSESSIDSSRIREGRLSLNDIQILGKALDTISVAPIWVDDQPGIKLSDLRARAQRFAAEHTLDLIIVDYLQLLHDSKNRNRVEEVSAISAGLKELARELEVPVLALSQLSRAVESRTPHIPMLSDLRDSGSIEQDADVVMFIYREDVYDRDSERKGIADLLIAKHRNGPTGVVSLMFSEATTRFINLTRGGYT